ncbi:Hypothetical protein CAP_6517 [Chondromyces apiculatus DSM 436]|uniref:Uncharacterized protein n=1 Tax=Chondromyces apiculatus DSM 436 TaxID=1192034 RepID=A0A017T1A4_9BACT|nr:Hypothetical protein CAP_6517 [Chondromyces apiculatus DSM 436]
MESPRPPRTPSFRQLRIPPAPAVRGSVDAPGIPPSPEDASLRRRESYRPWEERVRRAPNAPVPGAGQTPTAPNAPVPGGRVDSDSSECPRPDPRSGRLTR